MATETETGAAETEAGNGAVETSDSAAEPGGGISDFMRSIIVTTTATLAGVVAGVLSTVLAAGPNDNVALGVLGVTILVQFPLYYLVGIDVRDFGTKDKLYVAFMTFSLWFVTWSILMTAGSLQ
ncbi:hypothetical protein [Halovenus marina]|uniref:EMC6-like membrane protein n=1 Tax=Halovenus marina TaxID=3396621 RepID=UPI003F54F531